MNFQRERLSPDLFDEIRTIAVDHFKTTDPQPGLDHGLDRDFYMAADRNGNIRIFTARDEQKRLVGYAVFFVGAHQHYRQSFQAIQDAIYLRPDGGRRGWALVKFIRFCDLALAEEGIEVVHHFSPLAPKSLDKVLRRAGYEMEQLVYARRIG